MVRAREQLTPEPPDDDRWPGLLDRLDAAIASIISKLAPWLEEE